MSLVLDSSAALGWIYPDENTKTAATIFNLVVAAGAWVPCLWPIEVANSLQVGIRRGRIDRAFRDAVLADLMRLDISVDPDTSKNAWGGTVQLADRFRLTVYDAAYLELAQRRSLPLASLDGALRGAAERLGVELVA